jgi:hypothetical protein
MARRQPKLPSVPLPVWQELLVAANAFRTAQPWTWLDDADIFAVIDDDGRPWFPSVLGSAGLVFGLALYRGESGLRFLAETVPALEDSPRDAAFLQDALLLEWGAKQDLAPEDLSVLAALGHRPRSRERHAWPSFRSHSPGWFPWHFDEAEARAFTAGTRALLACAELARGQPDFFASCALDGAVLPTVTMAATRQGPLQAAQIEWRRWLLPPLPSPPAPTVPPTWRALAERAKNSQCVLEFDIFHAMIPSSDGGRPYFPRLGLMVDGKTGYIYTMELASPDRAWADLVTIVWEKALTALRDRPAVIVIRRPEWVAALQPLADRLGIRLELADELPFIDEARDSMERHLGG